VKYIGKIIDIAREEASNEDVGDNDGISNSTVIGFANEAQAIIQMAIVNNAPVEFVVQKIITLSGNEEVTIPDRLFVNNRFLTVEFCSTGNAGDYYKIPAKTMHERRSVSGDSPSFYIRRSGKLLLNPIPSSGFLRVNYYRQLDDLDIRRGIVSSVAGTGVIGDALTQIELNTSGNPSVSTDLDALGPGDYLCINDKDGIVKTYNIPVTSASSSTGIIIVPSFILGTGDVLPVVGDYVTIGEYTTTHSKLINEAERYLQGYMVYKMQKLDSSVDVKDSLLILGSLEEEIIDSFGDTSEDIELFPVFDQELLD